MELPLKSKGRYLSMLKGLKRSTNTISSYDLDLNALFRFLLQKNYEFTTASINEYLFSLEKKAASSNTIRRHALAIRGFLRFMNERTHLLHQESDPWALAARMVEVFGLKGEEIVRLKTSQVQILEGGTILISNLREITLSSRNEKLAQSLMVYLKQSGERAFPFTKRLLEMKLKDFSEKSGIKLSLRSLRHLAAKRLYIDSDQLIKEKLGLTSDYSLKAYEKFKLNQ